MGSSLEDLKVTRGTVGGFRAHKIIYEGECLASIASYGEKIVHRSLLDAVKNGIRVGGKKQLKECTDALKAWVEEKRKEAATDPDSSGSTDVLLNELEEFLGE